MAWECAECHAREGAENVFVDAACHHCGKLLCHLDRVLLEDDAFSDFPGDDRVAVHCRDCRQRHHPRASAVTGTRPGGVHR